MNEDYTKYITERYQGEVYGEALFRTLAEHTKDEERRYKWRVLERLELETKERIRPALEGLGLDAGDDGDAIRRGERHGRTFANLPWAELMRGFRSELEKFVPAFEKAEGSSPGDPESRDLLRRITLHERALLTFVMRELEGGDRSLEAVIAVLEHCPTR